ncbi:hypothetical protein I7I48_03404 [Histoplasma ohiense]|nr:hypothetical protein I7I48_03404 [Histoplasma ohiense (nom. inval.)]
MPTRLLWPCRSPCFLPRIPETVRLQANVRDIQHNSMTVDQHSDTLADRIQASVLVSSLHSTTALSAPPDSPTRCLELLSLLPLSLSI